MRQNETPWALETSNRHFSDILYTHYLLINRKYKISACSFIVSYVLKVVRGHPDFALHGKVR